MRPTVAEIDLEALAANYRFLEGRVRAVAGPQAGLIAVVKADAYGHGVELCGRALAEAGAGWLGVTSVEEARHLCGALAGLAVPRVLVMSGFFPGEEDEVVRQAWRPQVWAPWHLQLLEKAAGTERVAVHLEIDTGMGRQGVLPGAPLAELLEQLSPGAKVSVEGILTHFSSPEDAGVTQRQLEDFRAALQQARAAGLRPRWVHAGNSATALESWAIQELAGLARALGAELLVRPGLGLYGVPPALPKPEKERPEPVMRWRTEVVSVREVPAGTPVGYGETFRAPEGGARLALLPVGYADGLRRELSNRGSVLVRGQRAPIAGRVSMDQTVIDVSQVSGVDTGDEVVLLGRQGEESIAAWEMAGWFGGIAYEAVCGVGARVRRVAREARALRSQPPG